MTGVTQIQAEQFHEEVIEAKQPVLVDFWAPWCSYCTKLSPILDELAGELGDKIKVVAVNVDEDRLLAQKYGVMSLPTVILFKAGEQVEKMTGFMPKAAISAKIAPFI